METVAPVSYTHLGFDGLLNFYAGRNAVCDLPFERAFLNQLENLVTIAAIHSLSLIHI